jgi:putative flippase GtrA
MKRWLKFNAIGALGVAVQLTILAVLSRFLPHHQLVATAAAVELTVVHNFVWHSHYTWRDRRPHFVRFQLSNGLVSLIGNLLIMRLLVNTPILVASTVSILCCSLANFYLGNTWAFVAIEREVPNSLRPNIPKTEPIIIGRKKRVSKLFWDRKFCRGRRIWFPSHDREIFHDGGKYPSQCLLVGPEPSELLLPKPLVPEISVSPNKNPTSGSIFWVVPSKLEP